MYWPLGAPRIYAASSSSKARRERVVEFEDDAESRETTEGSGSLVEAPSVKSDGNGDGEPEAHSGVATPATPITPGIRPVEHDAPPRLSARLLDNNLAGLPGEQLEKEPLLALRLSRTGHLFAVITSTSLTIWQTKV